MLKTNYLYLTHFTTLAFKPIHVHAFILLVIAIPHLVSRELNLKNSCFEEKELAYCENINFVF